jgi:hypothetical protein
MLKSTATQWVLSALCVVTFASTGVKAQSTLFNIPSTDVVAIKKAYVEFDFVSHLEAHQKGGFQSYIPRVVVGIAKNLEAGANVAFLDTMSSAQPVELQPNVKYRFYEHEEYGLAAAAGGILYTPIANRTSTDSFGLLYTTFSKKFKGDRGPRLTGGGYGLVGRANGNGSEGGAIVGYEQPLFRRVNFVADWLSGKNRFGYLTPGVSITVTKSSALYAGYSVGNFGRKNHALFLYYGITF